MNDQRTTSNHKMDASQIQSMFVVVLPEEDDDEREYKFTDPSTERSFQIRRICRADNVIRYHLCELVPTGRLVKLDNRGLAIHGWDDPRIKELESTVGPNGVMPGCRELGIDPNKMVSVGAGFSVDSRYHDSLESCAQAIATSINNNIWYNAYRVLSDEEKASLHHKQAVSSAQYWQDRDTEAKAAETSTSGLFKGCHNMLGPLSEQHQKRILGYLNAPTQELWNEIRGYVVVSGTTLWQAWGVADKSAPRSGDVGFPDPETLRLAIRQAVANNRERIDAELKERRPAGPRLC